MGQKETKFLHGCGGKIKAGEFYIGDANPSYICYVVSVDEDSFEIELPEGQRHKITREYTAGHWEGLIPIEPKSFVLDKKRMIEFIESKLEELAKSQAEAKSSVGGE